MLLAIALAAAGLAFWSIHTAQHYLERSRLAHLVYDEYLSLSSHTYQLFKQFGDALLIGDRDRGAGEAALTEAIRADITEIRRLIALEVRVLGEGEIEELEGLARIEQKIEGLLAAFTRIVALDRADDAVGYWRTLSTILDERIDVDFQAMIESALAEERREVLANQAAMERAAARFRALAIAAAALAAATATAGVVLLRRALTAPLQRLLAGADAVGRGDFAHRIAVESDTELDRVAAAFNQMTGKVEERERGLTASRDELEREVARRTEELNGLLDTLKRSEANRKRLIADVSHELRTPLTIIRGEADVALRRAELPAEDYREALRRTRDAAAHTARIVEDLLLVARQEAGEVRLELAEVHLSALVRDVVEAARSLGGAPGQVAMEPGPEPAPVEADAVRVKQVVTILLENALRYGGAHVRVRLARAPGGYRIEVADDGPGMSQAERERAFDRFYRGAGAAHDATGAGLGLPVAKALAEAHGGQIFLESPPQGGLVAAVVLPERPAAAVVA